jgi:hypothetical protein
MIKLISNRYNQDDPGFDEYDIVEEKKEMKTLPDFCYSVVNTTGELIIIKKGESGYYRTDYSTSNKGENIELKNLYNERLGVTALEENCMKVGSMFGWDVPGADPNNYDENGKFVFKEEE